MHTPFTATHLVASEPEPILAEMNITPLVDIMLVLLLIVMITDRAEGQVDRQSHIDVQLPNAQKNSIETAHEHHLVFKIDAKGTLSINNEIYPNEKIHEKLHAEFAKSPKQTVILEADGRLPHAQIVEQIDNLRRVGFVKIGIATQNPRS
jgi:biopolymer transport protein ExbD